MGTNGLPDIYTLSPRACGPRALGVYIRQTMSAHVMCHGPSYWQVKHLKPESFQCVSTTIFIGSLSGLIVGSIVRNSALL